MTGKDDSFVYTGQIWKNTGESPAAKNKGRGRGKGKGKDDKDGKGNGKGPAAGPPVGAPGVVADKHPKGKSRGKSH